LHRALPSFPTRRSSDLFGGVPFRHAELALADDARRSDHREVGTGRELFRREAAVIVLAFAREDRVGVCRGERKDKRRSHGFLRRTLALLSYRLCLAR